MIEEKHATDSLFSRFPFGNLGWLRPKARSEIPTDCASFRRHAKDELSDKACAALIAGDRSY